MLLTRPHLFLQCLVFPGPSPFFRAGSWWLAISARPADLGSPCVWFVCQWTWAFHVFAPETVSGTTNPSPSEYARAAAQRVASKPGIASDNRTTGSKGLWNLYRYCRAQASRRRWILKFLKTLRKLEKILSFFPKNWFPVKYILYGFYGNLKLFFFSPRLPYYTKTTCYTCLLKYIAVYCQRKNRIKPTYLCIVYTYRCHYLKCTMP